MRKKISSESEKKVHCEREVIVLRERIQEMYKWKTKLFFVCQRWSTWTLSSESVESCGIIAIVIVADKYRLYGFTFIYFFSFTFLLDCLSECVRILLVAAVFFSLLHTNSCICPELYSLWISEYYNGFFFCFHCRHVFSQHCSFVVL